MLSSAQVQCKIGNAGQEMIGRRVRVFWASDKTWYKGSLPEFSASSGRHLCEYDDGDRQWIDLAQEKYELDEGTVSRLREGVIS